MKGFENIKVLILIVCMVVGVEKLHSAGEGWGWGGNWYGQLGDNSTTNRTTPVQTHIVKNLISIDGGCDYSLGAKLDGTVWAWGRNNYGQLGVNSNTNYDEPIQTWNLTNVVTVATGYYHALALKSDGIVWAWGSNSQGQVGDNTSTNRLVPVQTHIVSNIIEIDAGVWHSLALMSDSTVWIWGRNNEGEVGDNTTTNRFEPESTHITPDVIAIAGGAVTSHAIKSDNTLWSWGSNTFGQLGINSSGVNQLLPCSTHITDVIAVDGGDGHTIALKSDGTVWSWGRNNDGQLGIGSTGGNQLVPVQTNITDVVQIIAGAQHSIAKKSDGTIWAWGRNQNGQLGDNSTTTRPSPVQVRGGEQGGQYLTGINLMNAGGWHSVAVENAPVAVELTGFDALPLSFAIVLRWKEASIAESFQYIIKRSIREDEDYSEIVKILGAGSSPSPNSYSHKDEDVEVGIRYYYKLGVVRRDGNTQWYGPESAVVTGKKPFLSITPNPFTEKTVIEFKCSGVQEFNSQLPNSSTPQLRIFDVGGREVKHFSLLPSSFILPAKLEWDGKDDYGKLLPSGIYFCKLSQDTSTQTKKILFVK